MSTTATPPAVKSLDELLDASGAAPEFKEALRSLAAGRPQDRVTFNRQSPPVKVLRLAMKLLESFPDLRIENLAVDAQSGCSTFSGEAVVQPGGIKFDFEWDCKWRAEQMGWNDPFGDPDQIRAAREFGYQCFNRLERI